MVASQAEPTVDAIANRVVGPRKNLSLEVRSSRSWSGPRLVRNRFIPFFEPTRNPGRGTPHPVPAIVSAGFTTTSPGGNGGVRLHQPARPLEAVLPEEPRASPAELRPEPVEETGFAARESPNTHRTEKKPIRIEVNHGRNNESCLRRGGICQCRGSTCLGGIEECLGRSRRSRARQWLSFLPQKSGSVPTQRAGHKAITHCLSTGSHGYGVSRAHARHLVSTGIVPATSRHRAM